MIGPRRGTSADLGGESSGSTGIATQAPVFDRFSRSLSPA
jgi:hypothetical protein